MPCGDASWILSIIQNKFRNHCGQVILDFFPAVSLAFDTIALYLVSYDW